MGPCEREVLGRRTKPKPVQTAQKITNAKITIPKTHDPTGFTASEITV
jgi:hypothetical protein